MQNLTIFIQIDKIFFIPNPKINHCSVAQTMPSVQSTVTSSPPHLLYNPHQSLWPLAAQHMPSGVNFSKSAHSTISSPAFNSALQTSQKLEWLIQMATQQLSQPWASQVGPIHTNSPSTTGDTPPVSPRRRAIHCTANLQPMSPTVPGFCLTPIALLSHKMV